MKRYSNFELLRIILMLLIISEHIISYSNTLLLYNSVEYYISNILMPFCAPAVNIFILISGYFGIKLKQEKLIKIDLRVIFYTWFMFLIGVLFKIHKINIIKDVLLILPVITKQYWFITIYIVLCILSPFINSFLKNLSKEYLEKFLITGFVLFYLISTFCFLVNSEQIVNDAGYGIINFIYIYSLGYYIKNYYKDKHSANFYICMYFLTSISIFISNQTISKILELYFNSFISYNTIFVLLQSYFLFMAFKNIKLGNIKIINKIASKCLIVYIIHMNPTVSTYFFENILKVNKLSGANLILGILIFPFIIYAISYIIDLIVDFILKPIENKISKNKFNTLTLN